MKIYIMIYFWNSRLIMHQDKICFYKMGRTSAEKRTIIINTNIFFGTSIIKGINKFKKPSNATRRKDNI